MILPCRESWVFVVCLVFRKGGGVETLPVAISESASLQALET